MWFYLFCLFVAVEILINVALVKAFFRIPQQPSKTFNSFPVSIVVAAHNEESNLPALLKALTSQIYPQYEIIIALDRPTDGSIKIVDKLIPEHPYLSYVVIEACPDGLSPKKNALTTAINKTKYDYLLFTDADCFPNPNWISQMMKGKKNEKEIVLGISPYRFEKGLLNKIIRFETHLTALKYVGLANMGFPYMGVGRNIGYSKALFEELGGFESHNQILSGDDDLLVNQAAGKYPIRTVISNESLIPSIPKGSFRSLIKQKTRHISAGNNYSSFSKNILIAQGIIQPGIYAFGILSLLSEVFPFWIAGIFLFRWFSWGLVFARLSFLPNNMVNGTIETPKKWVRNDIWYFFLILDIIYLFYSLILVPLGLIKKVKW